MLCSCFGIFNRTYNRLIASRYVSQEATMRRVGRISSLIFVAILITSCKFHSSAIKPNIILINVDDMGWKDLSFMGSEFYETPNIDSLAKNAKVFTNGYASASNCAPSRACMLTGLWPQRHGVYTVGTSERGEARHRKLVPSRNTEVLPEGHTIIAKVLQQEGYKTCIAGKWHLSADPINYGFDLNIGGSEHGNPGHYDVSRTHVPIKPGNNEYLTDLIMEHALAFLDTVNDPFFLYYSP